MNPGRAFTLIELLVVIAIIAIVVDAAQQTAAFGEPSSAARF
jgi:prepilin-type N-terminal cleavage/methylation domain-containing protein